jgi:hypothetical protein
MVPADDDGVMVPLCAATPNAAAVAAGVTFALAAESVMMAPAVTTLLAPESLK